MSLTQEAEQRLRAVGLIEFFNKDAPTWRELAKDTSGFVASHFPEGAQVRQDDVALALVPVLLINISLKSFLQGKKLTQKYWFRDFADLILDHTWATIRSKS